MRWLASRPRRLLAGAFGLLLVAMVLGWVRSEPFVSIPTGVLLFLLFFATLIAFTRRRETPRPPSPR